MLNKEFAMKDLGVGKKIFQMEIYEDMKIGKLWLTHKIYVKKMLEKVQYVKG